MACPDGGPTVLTACPDSEPSVLMARPDARPSVLTAFRQDARTYCERLCIVQYIVSHVSYILENKWNF